MRRVTEPDGRRAIAERDLNRSRKLRPEHELQLSIDRGVREYNEERQARWYRQNTRVGWRL